MVVVFPKSTKTRSIGIFGPSFPTFHICGLFFGIFLGRNSVENPKATRNLDLWSCQQPPQTFWYTNSWLLKWPFIVDFPIRKCDCSWFFGMCTKGLVIIHLWWSSQRKLRGVTSWIGDPPWHRVPGRSGFAIEKTRNHHTRPGKHTKNDGKSPSLQ